MLRRRCLEASVKVVRDIAEQQIWHVGTPIRSDSKMLAESRLDARLGVSFAWPRFLPAVGLCLANPTDRKRRVRSFLLTYDGASGRCYGWIPLPASNDPINLSVFVALSLPGGRLLLRAA